MEEGTLLWFRDKGELCHPLLPVFPRDARKKGNKFSPASVYKASLSPFLSHPASTRPPQPMVCTSMFWSLYPGCQLQAPAVFIYHEADPG